jgi:hypothetical protein
VGLTSIVVVDGTLVVLHAGLIALRLSRRDGITHAAWSVIRRLEDDNPHTETLCRLRLDVPWRNTGRFREGRIDCMSCLVRMSRMTS